MLTAIDPGAADRADIGGTPAATAVDVERQAKRPGRYRSDDDLAAATDDEIFDLLDNELGTS